MLESVPVVCDAETFDQLMVQGTGQKADVSHHLRQECPFRSDFFVFKSLSAEIAASPPTGAPFVWPSDVHSDGTGKRTKPQVFQAPPAGLHESKGQRRPTHGDGLSAHVRRKTRE